MTQLRIRRAVIGALALALLSCVLPDDAAAAGNAADWYQRAIDRIAGLSDSDRQALAHYAGNPGQAPSAQVREILARTAPALEAAPRGARLDGYDQGLDYGQGFDLRLPHLSQMRQVAQIMQADALMRMHDGDTAGASRRIGTLYRMGMHVSGDGTLISSLVAQSIFQTGEDAAQAGFDRAAMNASDASAMLRSLDDLDSFDPFGYVESMAMEQSIAQDWLARSCANAEDREAFFAEKIWLGDNAAALGSLTDEEFSVQLAQLDGVMDRVVTALSTEDREAARAALDAITEEVRAGEHGLLATSMVPMLGKVFDWMTESQVLLADRRAMLAELAEGRVAPSDRVNAALIWQEAIRTLDACERSDVERVLAWGLDGDAAPDEAVVAFLDEAGEVLELAGAASEKARCDFSVLRPDDGDMLQACPEYAAGMHEVLGIVLADARRRLGEGDAATAAARMSVVLRAVGQLSDDDPLASALVAHDAFGRVAETVATRAWSEASRMALLKAAQSIARKDPFGWIGSVMATREALRSWLFLQTRSPEPVTWADREEEVAAVVSTWDADALVYVLLVIDGLTSGGQAESGGRDGAAGPGVRPVDRCARLIDPDGAVLAGTDGAAVARAIAVDGTVDVVGEREIPKPARARERMRAARADLRELLNGLHAEPESGAAAPG